MSRPISVVVAAIFDKRGHVLMGLRSPHGSRPNLWELPGGRVEAGEDHVPALWRELHEELGVQAHVFPSCLDHVTLQCEHDYRIFLYRARIQDGMPMPISAVALEWFVLEQAIVDKPLVPSTYLFYTTLREVEARIRDSRG